MPFDTAQADTVPTRRSSRYRVAAVKAPAAGASAAAGGVTTPLVGAPLTRRSARERLGAAETAASIHGEERVDAFAQAARAFGTAPIAEAADAASASKAPVDDASAAGSTHDAAPAGTAYVASRRPLTRRFLAFGATVGVMSVTGLLAVGMTVPPEAVAASGSFGTARTSLVASAAPVDKGEEEIQAFVTASGVQNEQLVRSEEFSTVSLVDLASEQGIKFSDSVFTNDPDAAIQWPFLVGVSMSSGYGLRWGRMHEGIDFTPGEGAPIQAIADGTVRIATEQGGGYGVTVYIDHVIDGKVITSHYSHMQYGSLQVQTGDKVKVGDIVGLTGNTGHSFGAHLHFEIIVNGSTIDPLPWLRANAGRSSLD
ncbi:M23 family metallopeptidase [Microbacterium sp.]|uniref:M23 family metallopeptidase n=1 Tax=Microbacterium sp. TaxID=51671 RepID=UPI0039E44E1A